MRIKLSEKYQTEREEICKKIIGILDLKEDNTFILYELDKDIEKQNKISKLQDEIKKYFAVSCISSFKPNVECKRPYLSTIRNILRKQNYSFIGNDYLLKDENNEFKRTIKYFIFKTI